MNLQKKNTNYHYMTLLGKTSKLLTILREKKKLKHCYCKTDPINKI